VNDAPMHFDGMKGVRFWLKSYFDRDAAWNELVHYGLNVTPPDFWEKFIEKWRPILREQERQRAAESPADH